MPRVSYQLQAYTLALNSDAYVCAWTTHWPTGKRAQENIRQFKLLSRTPPILSYYDAVSATASQPDDPDGNRRVPRSDSTGMRFVEGHFYYGIGFKQAGVNTTPQSLLP